ncbi:Uncharacterised protein [Klebsiella pneumoniae]|nr:Uncharacterised protein [Klebsiella pneumoniae]
MMYATAALLRWLYTGFRCVTRTMYVAKSISDE